MLTKSLVGTFVMSLAIGATSVIAVDVPGANAKGAVTIVGCLRGSPPADEYALSLPNNPVGTSGAEMVTYRLTNVTMKAMPTAAKTWVVVGTPKQFAAHAGRQVEIAGTIIKADPAARTIAPEPAVRVESVRMISAKCSATR